MGTTERPKIFEVGIQWASTINMLDMRRFLEDGNVPLPREALQSIEVCNRKSKGCHKFCLDVGVLEILGGESSRVLSLWAIGLPG